MQLAQKYLDEGLEPVEMIEKGLSGGIRKLGDLFDRGEVFLPHLIIASEAMTASVKVLEQALPADQVGKKLAKVVLGTVEGDVHDIGTLRLMGDQGNSGVGIPLSRVQGI